MIRRQENSRDKKRTIILNLEMIRRKENSRDKKRPIILNLGMIRRKENSRDKKSQISLLISLLLISEWEDNSFDVCMHTLYYVLIKLWRTIVICLIVCVQKLYAIWKIMDILDFNGSLFVSAEYSGKYQLQIVSKTGLVEIIYIGKRILYTIF